MRDTLAVPENIAGELKAVLSPALVRRIDGSTLTAEPGTFVDRAGESRTDLLFSAQVAGRHALIYVLFEHQSRPDPEMTVRMLGYMSRIWASVRRSRRGRGERPRPVPPILPVVLHHGREGWTAARTLSSWIDWDDELRSLARPFVPEFELIIDDLAKVPEMELARRGGAPLGRLVLMALRATRVGFDESVVEVWAEMLDDAERTAPREALLHLLEYLVGTDEGTALLGALDSSLSSTSQEIVMGLKQELMERGRAEGRAEALAEALLKQLKLRFGEPLPDSAVARVTGASVDEIDAWIERVLTARTLDEVLGD